MTDMLTPGSLTARVLAQMLATRTESAPDELARDLEADEREVRQALGTLRRLGKVLQRVEDGKAVYRLPDAAHMRIAGSALQVVRSPLELRPDAKPAKAAKPAKEPTPPKEAPMTDKPPVKPGTDRARMLELITQEPGLTGRDIAKRLGLERAKTTLQLQQMKERGLIVHSTEQKPFEWKATGAKRAHVSTPATKAPKAKADKPAAARKAPRRAKKLAELGTPTPTKGHGIHEPALAIDEAGTVAIESVKLSPRGIQRVVAFLEKTQHVWMGAV